METSGANAPLFDYGEDTVAAEPWRRATSGKGRWPYPPDFWEYLSDEVRPFYEQVRTRIARANKVKRKAWAERNSHPWPASPSELALRHTVDEFGLPMNGARLANIFSEMRKSENSQIGADSALEHFRE